MNASQVTQIIQCSLIPGVMISSSALFLLGLHNRSSNLFSRYRTLNQEKRILEEDASKTEKEEKRLRNVTVQLEHLFKRARSVKNAILCFYAAVLCFVGTSISLFFSGLVAFPFAEMGAVLFFLGLVLIFLAAILLISEIMLAFRILKVESRS